MWRFGESTSSAITVQSLRAARLECAQLTTHYGLKRSVAGRRSCLHSSAGSNVRTANRVSASLGNGEASIDNRGDDTKREAGKETAADAASCIEEAAITTATKAKSEGAADGKTPLLHPVLPKNGDSAPAYWGFSPIPFVARGRSMPGQRLLPCTKEDAAILSKAAPKYPSPQEVEGGIIVRIIAAKDVQRVTSPVLRVVRNRQYGIRKGERLKLALGGVLFSGLLASLGFWQLRRMHEKKELIEYKMKHLARQPAVISSSPFPWTLEAVANARKRMQNQSSEDECSESNVAETQPGRPAGKLQTNTQSPRQTPTERTAQQEQQRSDEATAVASRVGIGDGGNSRGIDQHQESVAQSSKTRIQGSGRLLATTCPEDVEASVTEWAYTPVVLHGVLDSSTELLVGPRPGLDVGNPGYCVVSPLRLKDGSVILVNKGHLPTKLAKLPPYPKSVDENAALLAMVQRQRRQQQQRTPLEDVSAEQIDHQVRAMQQQRPKQNYVNCGAQQYLEHLQQVAGSRMEVVGPVTVRGILEPGEVANSSFKSLMLRNRPHEGQFNVLSPRDLVEATPGIPNVAEASLLMVNAYSIVYDEDLLHLSTSSNDADVVGVANRFMSYEQKKKDDYLLFYADEHTHFNYACQWFLMGLCTAAMTLYKIIEVSRWRW